MLLGQHFGGGHQRALESGGDGGQQGGQGHYRLPASDFTLQQPVHWRRFPGHIISDFCDAPACAPVSSKGRERRKRPATSAFGLTATP